MHRLTRVLSSTGLTLSLCLALAAVGAAGSFLYYGNTAFGKRGYLNLFQTPVFIVPVVLLAVNVLVCAGSRLRQMSSRSIRPWTFSGIHLGLVLVIAGMAADGLLGFVGTGYFFVGAPSSAYHDWGSRTDATFPFAVEVTDVNVTYHPLDLRIGIRDLQGNKKGLYEVREGRALRVDGGAVRIVARRFETDTKTLVFDAWADGRLVAGMRAGSAGSAPIGGIVVVPVAYKDPEASGYSARITFIAPDGTRTERTTRPNRPAVYSGFSFCVVGTGADPYGNPYVGLQTSREPGQPLVWGGSVLFCLSLLAHILARGRAFGMRASATVDAPAPRPAAVALVAALAAAALPAGDALAGGRVIAGDEAWEGVVRVSEPVTVEKGATLRVRPGTRVLLSGDDRDGDGCRDGYIQVFGTLRVEGEKERPVTFAPLEDGKPWEEIFLSEARAVIRHARFTGARWGLHVHGGDVSVERARFQGNEGGARTRGTGARFDRCTFRGNGTGLRFWDGGPRVLASVIEGNGVGVFYREGTGGGRISGSRIANRDWDLKVGDWASGDLDVSGNFWGNGQDGGVPRRFIDYRDPGGGRVVLAPSLSAAPGDCGADAEGAQ